MDETQYDLVFYPGGHGVMVDLAFDETSGSLLTRRLRSGKPLALLEHGVAAILAAKNPHNPRAPSPFADYQVTGISTVEEKLSPFSRKIPWYLEDRLAEIGVYYHKARIPFRPFIVQDRHLYTGQNPASSEALAHCLVDDIG